MKVMVIPIVIGAPDTISKGFVNGLKDIKMRGQVETIQTPALLRLAKILRRVLEAWGHSNSSERPSANAGLKHSQGAT